MDINVAFWNLGNLFDTTHDPIANDFDFLPERGWTEETKAAKVANLGRVIDLMFDGRGPDLLGVCEVENDRTLREVLDAVTVRSDLRIVPFRDGPDIRGIDCALVVSDVVFEAFDGHGPDDLRPESYLVHNRYPTRDIFEVPLRVRDNGAELLVYVNHWPSRSRGRMETEPLRIAVANHLGHVVDRRLKISRQELGELADTAEAMAGVQRRWDRNVLIMGDLNDEPYDRSVLQELGASSGLDRLEEPLKKHRDRQHLPRPDGYAGLPAPLFNCMWPLSATPDRGSYHFAAGQPTSNMLDQFVVSRGLYYGSSGLRMRRRLRPDPALPPEKRELATVDADVFDHPVMATAGKRRPKKFSFGIRSDGTAFDNDGFSDHFPIVTAIETV